MKEMPFPHPASTVFNRDNELTAAETHKSNVLKTLDFEEKTGNLAGLGDIMHPQKDSKPDSSRNQTPLCARLISPGRGTAPPPDMAAPETVWCGARNGRADMMGLFFPVSPATE